MGAHLISVPQQYPDKRLCLEVRQLTGWSGTPRGHEGQALVWVPADKLTRYDMPPADRPVVAALLFTSGLLLLFNASPAEAYRAMWDGAFGGSDKLLGVMAFWVPLNEATFFTSVFTPNFSVPTGRILMFASARSDPSSMLQSLTSRYCRMRLSSVR